MKNTVAFLMVLTLALTACRGNLPRPDAEQDNTRTTPETERRADTTAPATSQSGSGSYLPGDGPGTDTPANLHQVPDAVPRAEPLHRYANRPYTVLGKNYTPLTQVGHYKERGIASWYGKKFHGKRTSIGEIYDMYGMTAAHTTLAIPSYARVTNLSNQKSIIVRINDRGPFMHDRLIDLSYTAASKLGIIGSGHGMVEVESLQAGADTPPAISPIYRAPLEVSNLPVEIPAAGSMAGGVYLQLGVFSSQRGAEEFMSSMRNKLNDSGKPVSLSRKNGLVSVRIGPYANIDAARATALELQDRLGFKPMLILN